MTKDKIGDCDVGDWFKWESLPAHQEEISVYRRDIKDFDMDKDNKVSVLAPMEWTFRQCHIDGMRAWKCVKKERIK